MLQMRFLRSSWCSRITWSSPEQPVKLTQKLATETTAPHSEYSYAFSIVGYDYTVIIINAMEFHILKLLKVNCSN